MQKRFWLFLVIFLSVNSKVHSMQIQTFSQPVRYNKFRTLTDIEAFDRKNSDKWSINDFRIATNDELEYDRVCACYINTFYVKQYFIVITSNNPMYKGYSESIQALCNNGAGFFYSTDMHQALCAKMHDQQYTQHTHLIGHFYYDDKKNDPISFPVIFYKRTNVQIQSEWFALKYVLGAYFLMAALALGAYYMKLPFAKPAF